MSSGNPSRDERGRAQRSTPPPDRPESPSPDPAADAPPARDADRPPDEAAQGDGRSNDEAAFDVEAAIAHDLEIINASMNFEDGEDEDGEEEEGEDDAFDQDGAARAWDSDDPRRRKDPMAPPAEPCECYCLHCGRTFMSDQIWFQRVVGDPQGFDGFWMCPTPNCGGAGFTFDIFPTNPAHPANDGWQSMSDAPDDDSSYEELGQWMEDDSPDEDYDPDEPHYRALEAFDCDDDDLEGEEWKYGLQPGERPENPPERSDEQAQQLWEQDQRKYDEPDQRPREIDWTNRTDRRDPTSDEPPLKGDEDIPF